MFFEGRSVCRRACGDEVTSVVYNGSDITHLVEGNLTDADEVKRIAFVEVKGAYLVISGLLLSPPLAGSRLHVAFVRLGMFAFGKLPTFGLGSRECG